MDVYQHSRAVNGEVVQDGYQIVTDSGQVNLSMDEAKRLKVIVDNDLTFAAKLKKSLIVKGETDGK